MEMIHGSLIVKRNREAGKAQSLYHVLLRAVFLESSNDFSAEKYGEILESKGRLSDILLKEEGTPLFNQ